WLRRAFEFDGLRVTHVKNITDVGHMRQDVVDRGEDKVIAAALAEGKTPMEIAATYEERFREDERSLNILPATVYPRATEHVPEMVALIERLLARGLAYDVDGTVYYAVKRFPGYGRLSGNVQEALKQGVRAEVDPAKLDPSDFALWKRAEEGRAALVWKTPWGDGYPGWHIECSAMSTRYLGSRSPVRRPTRRRIDSPSSASASRTISTCPAPSRCCRPRLPIADRARRSGSPRRWRWTACSGSICRASCASPMTRRPRSAPRRRSIAARACATICAPRTCCARNSTAGAWTTSTGSASSSRAASGASRRAGRTASRRVESSPICAPRCRRARGRRAS